MKFPTAEETIILFVTQVISFLFKTSETYILKNTYQAFQTHSDRRAKVYTLDFSLAMQHILPVFSNPIVFAPRRMLSWQVGVGRGTCPIRNRSVVYTDYENFIDKKCECP